MKKKHILTSLFCFVICTSAAQETIDLAKCQTDIWKLDGLYESYHTITMNSNVSSQSELPFANMLIGKDLFLMGETIHRIKDGMPVRKLSYVSFYDTRRSGAYSVLNPVSAMVDQKGERLYARGESIEGFYRRYYVETTDFRTGEVLDSIPLKTLYWIALTKNDSLYISNYINDGRSNILPDINIIFPDTYALYLSPRYCGPYMWLICWSNEYRDFRFYRYDERDKTVKQITGININGKDSPVEGLLGISNQFLAYVMPDEKQRKLEVTFYKLK